MNPYKAKNLPIEYKTDKELLRLVSEANIRYGVYKSLISSLEFDAAFFLESVLLNESYKSTQIEGTQVSQDEIYYLKYMKVTDDHREIDNLKKTIEYAGTRISAGSKIDYELVNHMHRIILESVRGEAKNPGEIRTTQNWIGPRGVGIDGATFVPPIPEEVYGLLQNLYEYMNDESMDPMLVQVGISHAQFETIHPYKDGNGRVGRALIPVQTAALDDSIPLLYLSEVLELYRPSYQRNLMEYRKGHVEAWIGFFMQCIIDQCNSYIYKIGKIKEIYKEDMKTIEQVRGNSIYKIMPVIMKQVVFTKKEVQVASGVSINVVSNTINRLVELGIIVPDPSVAKKGYRYKRIYEVFVGLGEPT